MKRGWVVLLIIVAIGALLAGGWWWARTSPEQVVDFLEGGGLRRSSAESFVASVAGQSTSRAEVEPEALVASGSIEGKEVSIVSELGGRITGLHVAEGDEVLAGQALVELDASLLKAQMAQAEAAVGAAQANLSSVEAGTHPGEVLAAEALLTQALAQQDAAWQVWQDTEVVVANPQEIQAQIVEAQSSVDLAAVKIEQALAGIASAELERDRYRAQGSMEEKWLYRIYDHQVQGAQAALEAARAERAGAKEMLAALVALRDNPLALESQVHQAESLYKVAVSGVAVAEAYLAELQAGPLPEEVGVAKAQVIQAEAAVSALRSQIDMMTLYAPIDGIVTSRSAHTGEAAIAGAILLRVANLAQVELTVYIPEDELGRVYLGQEVGVKVDSFPGRTFAGTVSHISQQAEFTPKNVQTEKERVNMVFAVKVRLLNPDHALKPGMPADGIFDE